MLKNDSLVENGTKDFDLREIGFYLSDENYDKVKEVLDYYIENKTKWNKIWWEEKDKKAFANDLKSIYHAPNEESGYERMQAVIEKWLDRYPTAMKRWEENWDVISPMFKFSADVRNVMYTTNAIERLNCALRRLDSQRSVFPCDTALLKALYLATFEVTKKWTMPLRNWGKAYGELSIM